MLTSRELVYKTLNFQNPYRAPRQLWVLPWAEIHYPEHLKKIKEDFPDDIIGAPGFYKEPVKVNGNPYEPGIYIDEWNCKFINVQRGIIGEVKEPIVQGENWEDDYKIRIPVEYLKIDKDRINEFCHNTDKFVLAGVTPNIFERLQYIRGTQQLLIDLVFRPHGMFRVIRKIHDFYCEVLSEWAKTDVDALTFMDDWGTQSSLLVNPKVWVEIFKPLYKDYIEIAHRHGKKIFMHSDGYILDIIPHLIELGLDAINSQIFCMGVEKLRQFRGKITFWGEIDRQYLLARGSVEEIEEAVKKVKENLWINGGCIAQCEFGIGAKPENVYKVFETWNKITA
ncbi:MAG TPA: methyltransferase [Thermotogaceae bacterium]|nr:methyltransferase [Thermotogaceae bacterium]